MASTDEDVDLDERYGARPTSAVESEAIASRYGRTKPERRRKRFLYLVAGILAAVIVVVWVLWAALDQSGGSMDAEDKGNTILSDRAVSISFQVSAPVGSTAGCALQVQNESHLIVGWRIVKLPASKLYTTSYTDVVRSAERGVTGLIYRCWLT